MSYRTNRRTLKPFPVSKSPRTIKEIFDDLQFKGSYLKQTAWLRYHGFAYFSEHITPTDYVWETWVDNFGNAVRIKWSRPSNKTMAEATVVDSEYIPAPERK